jgi:hypothetical protein
MTSPQEIARLVGHSPAQEEADIVERMQARAWAEPKPNELTWLISEAVEEVDALRAEIERLRTALRAVRACTDPAWQLQIIRDALREGEMT